MQALSCSWAPQSCGRLQTSPFAGRVLSVRASSDGRSCLRHESRSLWLICQGISAADALPCIVRAHCMRLDPNALACSQIAPAMQFRKAGFPQRIQRASTPTGDRCLPIRRPHFGIGLSCAQLGAGPLPAEMSYSPRGVEACMLKCVSCPDMIIAPVRAGPSSRRRARNCAAGVSQRRLMVRQRQPASAPDQEPGQPRGS